MRDNKTYILNMDCDMEVDLSMLNEIATKATAYFSAHTNTENPFDDLKSYKLELTVTKDLVFDEYPVSTNGFNDRIQWESSIEQEFNIIIGAVHEIDEDLEIVGDRIDLNAEQSSAVQYLILNHLTDKQDEQN